MGGGVGGAAVHNVHTNILYVTYIFALCSIPKKKT